MQAKAKKVIEEGDKIEIDVSHGFNTVEYEGCEYLVYLNKWNGNAEILHKENCKYH